jgi:hypothetical protein
MEEEENCKMTDERNSIMCHSLIVAAIHNASDRLSIKSIVLYLLHGVMTIIENCSYNCTTRR